MQYTVAIALVLLSLSTMLSSAASIAVDEEYGPIAQQRPLAFEKLHGFVPAAYFGPAKRSPHQIEARALSQFKNCYFSPIQCVLMERRRK